MSQSPEQTRVKPRPLSPHLQIWRWKIPMLTSILHRVTGAALVVGSLLIVWWVVAVAMGADYYNDFLTVITHPVGIAMLVGWSWAFWYQMLNGIRHLAFDAGYGFKLQTAFASGAFVLITSVLASAATWAYIFMGM